MTTAVMRREGVATAPGFDWETLRASVRVEEDLAATNAFWTMQAVLPQGPWIQRVLSGAITLTPD